MFQEAPSTRVLVHCRVIRGLIVDGTDLTRGNLLIGRCPRDIESTPGLVTGTSTVY